MVVASCQASKSDAWQDGFPTGVGRSTEAAAKILAASMPNNPDPTIRPANLDRRKLARRFDEVRPLSAHGAIAIGDREKGSDSPCFGRSLLLLLSLLRASVKSTKELPEACQLIG